MYEKLGRFLLKNRVVVVILIAIATGFFLNKALQIQVESRTIDLFPQNHPYVETFVKYKDIFGGASNMLIQMEVEKGDIFNTESLSKIARITKELKVFPAINNYQVWSIAQRKIKKRTWAGGGLKVEPIMWPDIPKTKEQMDHVKQLIYTSPRYHGTLVSLDSKAALIRAGFFAEKMEPKLIYDRVNEILAKESDENTRFSVIGRPVMLGHILTKTPEMGRIFLYSILAILFVLAFYFRDVRGVVIPFVTAIISAIWGVGFLSLLGHNFDLLVIVVPFIISARALSHSVQLIERYFEEYEVRRDRIEASVATFSGLFRPGMISIITDAAGVLLVYLTPIPLMQKLAIMGGFWVLSIIVSDIIFNPIFLSFFPPPKIKEGHKEGLTDRALTAVASLCFGKSRYWVLATSIVIFVVGYLFARTLVVGDVHPGTPMLWPDSKYNMDTDRIAKRFGNTEQFNVVVEGATREAIKHPEVLLTMEAFQKHMEALPEVSGTSSIVDLLPETVSVFHATDPKWELIPTTTRETGGFLEMIYSNSQPGDLTSLITPNSQNANLNFFLVDHKGETLRKVVDACKEFIKEHPIEGAKFLLAGGLGGLMAAINEVVTQHQTQVTVMAFSIVFIFCGIAYKSVLAGILFLIPLLISNYLTYALMGARNIGLDVNALPVVALGVGLGVDYGLYVVDRIKEEYDKLGDLKMAITTAIKTAGKAVTFTAATMVAGVAFWTFSFMRFQADMGLLLVFWMVISMLGGLIILPTLIAVIKPKFLIGRKTDKATVKI